jgi:putative tryptophan/tyrosine transport system substrate-binding protein
MRRRNFIQGIAASAAWPLTARAQQSALPVIGYLNSRAHGADPPLLQAFQEGLKAGGYVEGQNVAIEYRFAENNNDRLATLAADLLRRQVSVIFTNGPGVIPAKAATAAVPIVFAIGFDPIQYGLVASLNRPGGNVTGVVSLFDEIGPKRLELAHQVVPAATRMAVLLDPTYPSTGSQSKDLLTAAQSLGLKLDMLSASTDHDLDEVFATIVQHRPGAFVIGNAPFFNSRVQVLAGLSARSGTPSIFQTREFVTAGGLISYGPDLADAYRTAGTYAGRILEGEKPADLPVQRSSKFEMFINLKTAKLFGVTVPFALLNNADEVIE